MTDRPVPIGGTCRFCAAPLEHTFVDLGTSPLCESYVRAEDLDAGEVFYPLHVWVCTGCWMVQLHEYVSPAEIFTEYAYFSSYSDSFVEHARRFVASMTERLGLGPQSLVMEVASNDGYLLRHARDLGIPVLGIEPAANVAEAAIVQGIPTEVEFLGVDVAAGVVGRHGAADLVVANNVFAHVPDINDFTAGLRTLLAPTGVLSIEVAHLQRLVEGNQFDTIYHEHFQYWSVLAAERVLAAHGLRLFDVEELPVHGGSIRLLADRDGGSGAPRTGRLDEVLARERALGYEDLTVYRDFAARVHRTKRRLLAHLIAARDAGRSVAAYGAPGKGNTLLNYCGIRTDLVEFTVDRNPYKHGRYTPGARLPIHPVEVLLEARPDEILILPWNLRDEIVEQIGGSVRAWGGRFVVPIPQVEVIEP